MELTNSVIPEITVFGQNFGALYNFFLCVLSYCKGVSSVISLHKVARYIASSTDYSLTMLCIKSSCLVGCVGCVHQ